MRVTYDITSTFPSKKDIFAMMKLLEVIYKDLIAVGLGMIAY